MWTKTSDFSLLKMQIQKFFLLLLAPSVKEKGQPHYDHFMFQIESNPKALQKINKHYFELWLMQSSSSIVPEDYDDYGAGNDNTSSLLKSHFIPY